MWHDFEAGAPPPPRPRRTAPAFQLRFGAIFWRVFLITFVVLGVVVWLHVVRPNIPFRPRGHRIAVMLYLSPRLAFRAFLIAGIAGVVTDLVFRLIVRPLMVRWYYPKCLDPTAADPLLFRLGVGEEILDERPARRLVGRARQPGTLIRTNRRVYFFPYAWHQESWALPFEHVASARLVTPRRRVLGWVTGYPDHVVVRDDSGEETTLIVGAPEEVLPWFDPQIQPDHERPGDVLLEA